MVGKPGKASRYFDDVVLKHESDKCLIWPFAKQNGYGVFSYNGKQGKVHRFVCEIFHGSPPTPKHHAAHNCNVSECCNHRHLRWATHLENEADKIIFGTRPIGSVHGRTSLNEAQVVEIFAMKGLDTQRNIAKKFDVAPLVVHRIFNGQNWSHVTGMKRAA
jgi:hypothetical protein